MADAADAWAWSSPRCRALELDFDVRTRDPQLGRHLGAALAPLAVDDDDPGDRPLTRYTVAAAEGDEGLRYVVTREGERIAAAVRGGYAIDHLFWDLNRQTVEAARHRYLLVHAGAVARGGRAVLLPARSGSGKTTLTAGLLAAGFDYLSDESPGLDPVSRLVHPYHKPLSVEPNASPLLERFRPAPGAAAPEPWRRARWLADPRATGARLAGAARAAAIVAPAYRQGAATTLEPISRGEAVVLLAENSFNFADRSRAHLDVLADVARGCACYRLPFGDLGEATALVGALVGPPGGPS